MAKVAQTPGPWLLAGGAGIFSADCVKALARAGFEPGDFGSYNRVKQRIRQAKRRVRNAKPGAKPGEPGAPSAHDKLLAQSTNGHLQQNALFQRKRGNACQNEKPGDGGPGAPCYDLGLAPCAPLPRGTERAHRGTSHWAGGAAESAFAKDKKKGAPVSSAQCNKLAKNTIRLVAKGPTRSDVKGMEPDAKRRRSEERDVRAASAGDVRAKNAGKVPADQEGKKAAVDEDSAEKCIEAWMKLANEAMRRKVMNDYSSENYSKTKDKLEKAQAKAEQKAKDAGKERQEAYESGDRDRIRKARQEFRWAKQDETEAKAANASAHCLKAQVKTLQEQMDANGGAMPAMTGSVPGKGRSLNGKKGGVRPEKEP
jgi:hypothetical protein